MSDVNSTPTDRVMVDIETLGLEPGSVIVSLGAVRFGAGELGDTFYRSIDRDSCEDAGLETDEDTVEWWREQPNAAREVLHGGDTLRVVLKDFATWFDNATEIWANSPAFDCAHLEAAYATIGLIEPWEFYEERDFRTLKSLQIAPTIEHTGVEHNALDDAKHQARIAASTLQRIDDCPVNTNSDL